jgi:hypothetical protein
VGGYFLKLEIYGTERLKTNDPRVLSLAVPAYYYLPYRKYVESEQRLGRATVTKAVIDNTRHRSTGAGSQCNHFHGHCQQIASATGNSMTAVKSGIKWRAVDDVEYPVIEDIAGHAVPKSESDCSTYESYLLIEMAHVVAAELGIILIETPYYESYQKLMQEAKIKKWRAVA